MDGNIINISRFCTDDGPGIRTTVFLKGCPLSCVWCHNPESQKRGRDIMFNRTNCIGCMGCNTVCANGCHVFRETGHIFLRQNCIACGKCVQICPSNALELIGKTVSAESVFREIVKDAVFYSASNGGVTISGGEPLDQPEFTIEILKRCKENGIHTAIETSGFAGETVLKSVLAYCDLVLLDIKETNDQNHKNYTGVPFHPILQSLKTIHETGIPFIIRMPIIPTLNDRENHFLYVKNLVKDMNGCLKIDIMPYHILGKYKYEQLQRDYLCAHIPEPSEEVIEAWRTAVK